jgi:hypothetical protein
MKETSKNLLDQHSGKVVPQGRLEQLRVSQIQPSRNNPRRLFDDAPLEDLKENIRQHGVLVPITVYPLKGQDRYGILDGERRHRCCSLLESEGVSILIPANIVEPPTQIAGMLYMFSIHNFREQWELMPTALALDTILRKVGDGGVEAGDAGPSNKEISTLTGLSDAQIERCRKLLSFPEKYQNMSLEINPRKRIPSNFWIEALPVIDLALSLFESEKIKITRDEITDKLIEKYRRKQIKSVIHFRRVMEAWEFAAADVAKKAAVIETLKEYILDPDVETRAAFDVFVVDNRRVQSAITSCDTFVKELERLRLRFAVDNKVELSNALIEVRRYLNSLIDKIDGTDAPTLFGSIDADTEADEDE